MQARLLVDVLVLLGQFARLCSKRPTTRSNSYWDLADELGCRWDDPALEIPWPQTDAHISPRDAALQPFADLLDEFRAAY